MERIPRMICDSDYTILGVMSARYEYPQLKQVFLAHRSKRPKYTVLRSAVEQYSIKWHKKIIPVHHVISENEPRQERIRSRLQRNENALVNAIASEPASHENGVVVASVSESNGSERQSQATPPVVNNSVESRPSEAQVQMHGNQLSSSSVPSSPPAPLLPVAPNLQEETAANPFLGDIRMESGRKPLSLTEARSEENQILSYGVLTYRQISSSGIAPNYRDLLQQCPYGLSRIAEGDGPLESVTGLELLGIFRVAKQFGHLSNLKELLSCRPVTAVEKEEDLLRRIDWNKCKKDIQSKRKPATVHETSTIPAPDHDAPPNSPLNDPMQSRPPQANQCRTIIYEYAILVFAGRDLPIEMVTCYEPPPTFNRMCSYGGFDESGDRCFLEDWS